MKLNKHIIMISAQVLFIVIVVAMVYKFYPKTNVNVSGNFVRFDSINSNLIILSQNPDFSNPRYIDTRELKNFTLNLEAGTYYWKSDNGIIEGISHKFVIESEVGMKLNKSDNETDLVNIGNVKINVTQDDNGILVGHVILGPDESNPVNDSGNLTGRQSE